MSEEAELRLIREALERIVIDVESANVERNSIYSAGLQLLANMQRSVTRIESCILLMSIAVCLLALVVVLKDHLDTLTWLLVLLIAATVLYGMWILVRWAGAALKERWGAGRIERNAREKVKRDRQAAGYDR